MFPIRLVTLRPGHFHAALIQKEMLPGIERCVQVYSPLDDDLLAHLRRIAGFNDRAHSPTAWELDVHAGPDWLERFGREKPGNVAVLAGRNRTKIDLMAAAVDAGLHVLADKPWIIEANQLPQLERLLNTAMRSGLLVHDMMTERFEIASILQRDLVNDPEIFGSVVPGTPEEPGVRMASVHYLKKLVAGAPLLRPGWFFDIAEQGEALADVGTHLVDLVLWMLFTSEPIDYRKDVKVLAARGWPTRLTANQFREISAAGSSDAFDYECNSQVTYALRGVHVRLDVLWDFEAAPGGSDTHSAAFRGTKARVEVRQFVGGKPDLFVVPERGVDLRAALERRIRNWQLQFPGVALEAVAGDFRIAIPGALRTGHEAHFAEVLGDFLQRLETPNTIPSWETPHLLAKYFITTGGVGLARNAKA